MNSFDYTTNADFSTPCAELFEDMGTYSHDWVPQSFQGDIMSGAGYPRLSNSNCGPPNSNAPHETSSTTIPTLMGTFTQSSCTYPSISEALPILGPCASSGAFRLVGDTHSRWPGPFPVATNSAAGTPDPAVKSSGSTTPSWPLEPGQPIWATPSSLPCNSNEGIWPVVVPEYCRYPVESVVNAPGWSTTMAPEGVSASRPVPPVAFGKCRRGESNGDGASDAPYKYEMPPPNRVRGVEATGILAARSTTRSRQRPVARITKPRINNGAKKAGRGAEKLATPNSQGSHHQSSLGSRSPQGWAEEDVDGQLIWVKGNVEEKLVPQQKQKEQEYKLVQTPQTFETGCSAVLTATQPNWARGAAQEIKCRLCRNARLKTWDEFKYHCKCMEAHSGVYGSVGRSTRYDIASIGARHVEKVVL